MKRRYFFGITMLLLLIGGTYLYTEYTRKRVDTKSQPPSFKLQAGSWLEEFAANEQAAAKKYAGREIFVEVTGEVVEILPLDPGHYTILLGQQRNTSSVRCRMDSLYNQELAGVQPGQTLTIKGQFTGFKADELGIGADIEMNFCVLVKK